MVLALPHRGCGGLGGLSEMWLPAKATLNKVHPAAVLPAAIAGLWPADDSAGEALRRLRMV